MNPLTANDYPLIAVGPAVYRRMMSSPIFTACDDTMAADLAARLNAQEMGRWMHPHEHAGDAMTLVFGRAG